MTRFGLDGDMKAAEEDCYLVSDLITTVFVQQPLAKTVGLLRIISLKLISSHAYNNNTTKNIMKFSPEVSNFNH